MSDKVDQHDPENPPPDPDGFKPGVLKARVEELKEKGGTAFQSLHRDRDFRITNDLLRTFFDEGGGKGKLSESAKKLMAKPSNKRSPIETVLVRELAMVIWPVSGKSLKKFALLTGMNTVRARTLVWEAFYPIRSDEELRLNHMIGESRLQAIRFESVEKIVAGLWDIVAKTQKRVEEAIPEMDSDESLRVMTSAIAKALAITKAGAKGEDPANEPMAGTDTERLLEESEALDKRLQKLKLVKAG